MCLPANIQLGRPWRGPHTAVHDHTRTQTPPKTGKAVKFVGDEWLICPCTWAQRSVCWCGLYDSRRGRPLTLLLDLADLAHRLFEDGTFVRFDVEAVDVAEVGRDQLGQLLDVFALLLPTLPLTPAGDQLQGLEPD